MTTFIQILNSRIRLSSIKRYKIIMDDTLVIYYSLSSKNPTFESFKFGDPDELDSIVEKLDNILL